jgi:hypothetical protein
MRFSAYCQKYCWLHDGKNAYAINWYLHYVIGHLQKVQEKPFISGFKPIFFFPSVVEQRQSFIMISPVSMKNCFFLRKINLVLIQLLWCLTSPSLLGGYHRWRMHAHCKHRRLPVYAQRPVYATPFLVRLVYSYMTYIAVYMIYTMTGQQWQGNFGDLSKSLQ